MSTHLCEGVIVRCAAVGLFDQLTVHLVLQFWMRQAHLQCILGQGHVVVDGRRLHEHVDEQLTRLEEKGVVFTSSEIIKNQNEVNGRM